MKYIREFTGKVGQQSEGNKGAEQLTKDLSRISYILDVNAIDPETKEPGGVGVDNLQLGSIHPHHLSGAMDWSEYANVGEFAQRGTNVKWYGAIGDGATDDSAAFNSALSYLNSIGGGLLTIPKGTYLLLSTVNLYSNIVIKGYGIGITVINSTCAGFAFSYKSTEYITKQAPQFKDFTLNCYNGFQLNDPLSDILDGNSSKPQPYLMRTLFDNILINSYSQGSGTAIEWVKVFDSHIQHCNINNFATDFHAIGCDICSIRDNRIGNANILIHLESSGTFGSQMLIEHNDLLQASSCDCYIKTSDMFPTIRNNYLEQATGTFNCFFDITGGIEVRINDNRIEFNNNTSYTAIIRTDLMLLDMNRNTTKSGMSVGKGVQFVNPTYYGYSYFYWRKIIKHEQNTIERGFPYSYDASIPLNYAEIFNPSRGGLDSDSYGRSVLITDDAFVLAAVTPYSQTIRFNACLGRHIAFSLNNLAATIRNSNTGYSVGAVVAPSGGNGHLYVCIVAGTTGNTAPVFPLAEYATVTDGTVTWQELGKTLSGTFNVKIIAKATVPNQTLLCRAFNGATTQITSGNVIVANDQYKIYTVFSNVSAANLTLIFNNNNDTGNTGTIYIKEILVEYA